MQKDHTHLLSEQVKALSESATIKMAQKARDLKAQGHDVISLSLGEPDFDTPSFIKEAAIEGLNNGMTKYTPVPGLLAYREAIVKKFKRDNNLDFDTSQIVVSNGAKQSIANVCVALLDAGDEAIICTPYWVSYFEIVRFAGGTPVLLAADIEADFKVTAKQISDAINENTRVLLFSSPCNPTGSVYSKAELEAIAEVVAKHENLIVISDEIYEYINFTDESFSIGSIDSIKDQVVTINGMSKGFAMTGWRLGYMGAPKWIAAACGKIQGQFTSGATAFGQYAASKALLSDLSATKEMKKAFRNRRQLVMDLLADIPGIVSNKPQGAFYIFPDVSSYFGTSDGENKINNANDFAAILLSKAHVGTVSGSAFGNDNCIRISYAASEDQLKESMRRMKEMLLTFS